MTWSEWIGSNYKPSDSKITYSGNYIVWWDRTTDDYYPLYYAIPSIAYTGKVTQTALIDDTLEYYLERA